MTSACPCLLSTSTLLQDWSSLANKTGLAQVHSHCGLLVSVCVEPRVAVSLETGQPGASLTLYLHCTSLS